MSTSTANPRANSSGASLMYAASVNPPRRAKLQAAAALPALLPSPPGSMSPSPSLATSNISPAFLESVQAQQPRKKRGRKPAIGPGASSRAVREVARKANHSRIEKARREKINNALGELKALVPPDFASAKEGEEEEEEEEEEDDCDTPDYPTSSAKKASGKKAASEREFKLDILERTVLFVRALLQRVEAAEHPENANAARDISGGCHYQCDCGAEDGTGKKRKTTATEEDERDQKRRRTAVALDSSTIDEEQGRLSDIGGTDDEARSSVDSDDDESAKAVREDTNVAISARLVPRAAADGVRLPSIAELLSSVDSMTALNTETTQLPSPSLSPYLFPHYYHARQDSIACGGQQYLSPHLSPSVPSRMPTCQPANSEVEQELSGGRKRRPDPGPSCPVGMPYLLTPPSSDSTHHNVSAPALRLPSSALNTHECIEENINDARLESEGGDENVVTTDATRAATLALLQMRGAGGSRVSVHMPMPSSSSEIPSPTTRLSLTPGSLLGIGSGGRL